MRNDHERSAEMTYGDLEKDGAVRKEQIILFDALAACCFPDYATFLCTSGTGQRITIPLV